MAIKTYETREKLLGEEVNTDDNYNWSEAQCRAFWDGLICANLELIRDSVTEAEEVLEWVFSENFHIACRYAGLNVELLRDGFISLVDTTAITSASLKHRTDVWLRKRSKQQEQLVNGKGVWSEVNWGSSLPLLTGTAAKTDACINHRTDVLYRKRKRSKQPAQLVIDEGVCSEINWGITLPLI
ncbi:hypothetical protein ACROAG_09615 [Shewanella oncorhynchi]|uniref:hypothetical protein n=1 Tax=Shewanella oncorhynchi TaxID=2726434 RepID=UPI003D7A7948